MRQDKIGKVGKLKLLQQPEIGILIKKLRERLNLTQEEFAAELGVVFSTVNRWEKGHTKPSPIALKAIENMLANCDRYR